MVYSGPPQVVCKYHLLINIRNVKRFVLSFTYPHSHFFIAFLVFFQLRSSHIHYTNYRGLPVMGWNAGDDTGNLFNYKRLVGLYPVMSFYEKFS